MRRVTVYRSSRRRDTYLFVCAEEDLARVPHELLAQFGKPVQALSLELTAQQKLARADSAKVLHSIDRAGYYLQLPPRADAGSAP